MFIKLLMLVSLCIQYSSCCLSDSDCSLLGECNQGKCICDPGWTGEKCGQVDLLPTPRDGGYRNASLSSWGGNAIKIGQEWHMFVSAMSHNCSLSDFSTNSLSIHAISENPGGPYALTDISLPEFHHSTQIMQVNSSTLALFAIGIDTDGQNVHMCDQEMVSIAPKSTDSDEEELGPHDYMSVSTSTSGPDGPWEERVIFKTNLSEPYAWNCNKSNPAPIIFENGTVLLMYRGMPCERDNSCKNDTINLCQHQGIAVADSIDGPFIDRQGKISELSGNEDAFFFRTQRGYAALFHSKNACGQEPEEYKSCGSLAYSKDTWSWTLNNEPAYNATFQWKETDGKTTTEQLLSRQRPKIIFSEDGMTPLFLTNGVEISEEEWNEFTVAAPFNVPENQETTMRCPEYDWNLYGNTIDIIDNVETWEDCGKP